MDWFLVGIGVGLLVVAGAVSPRSPLNRKRPRPPKGSSGLLLGGLFLLLFGLLRQLVDSRWVRWLPELSLVLAGLVAIASLLYLAAWPRRQHRLGKRLVPLRPIPHHKLYRWTGRLFLFAALLQTVALGGQLLTNGWTGEINQQLTLSQGLFYWAAGLLTFSSTLQSPELREGGICYRLTATPWSHLATYSWDMRRTHLIVQPKARGWLPRQPYTLYVPARDVEIVDDILAQYLPQR